MLRRTQSFTEVPKSATVKRRHSDDEPVASVSSCSEQPKLKKVALDENVDPLLQNESLIENNCKPLIKTSLICESAPPKQNAVPLGEVVLKSYKPWKDFLQKDGQADSTAVHMQVQENGDVCYITLPEPSTEVVEVRGQKRPIDDEDDYTAEQEKVAKRVWILDEQEDAMKSDVETVSLARTLSNASTISESVFEECNDNVDEKKLPKPTLRNLFRIKMFVEKMKDMRYDDFLLIIYDMETKNWFDGFMKLYAECESQEGVASLFSRCSMIVFCQTVYLMAELEDNFVDTQLYGSQHVRTTIACYEKHPENRLAGKEMNLLDTMTFREPVPFENDEMVELVKLVKWLNYLNYLMTKPAIKYRVKFEIDKHSSKIVKMICESTDWLEDMMVTLANEETSMAEKIDVIKFLLEFFALQRFEEHQMERELIDLLLELLETSVVLLIHRGSVDMKTLAAKLLKELVFIQPIYARNYIINDFNSNCETVKLIDIIIQLFAKSIEKGHHRLTDELEEVLRFCLDPILNGYGMSLQIDTFANYVMRKVLRTVCIDPTFKVTINSGLFILTLISVGIKMQPDVMGQMLSSIDVSKYIAELIKLGGRQLIIPILDCIKNMVSLNNITVDTQLTSEVMDLVWEAIAALWKVNCDKNNLIYGKTLNVFESIVNSNRRGCYGKINPCITDDVQSQFASNIIEITELEKTGKVSTGRPLLPTTPEKDKTTISHLRRIDTGFIVLKNI